MNPETFEAVEYLEKNKNMPPLTPDNLKTKARYERERWEALNSKIEAHRGIKPIGNLLHFALNLGDCDFGYNSYINE